MKKIIFLALSFMLLAAVAAWGAEAPPAADDPALESRVMQLASQLRCLVCQNETIADSTADLASDLRNQIRDQMKRGATNQQIIDYMVARYGDFVLYKPPLKSTTLLLWAGPFVLLLIGLAALFYRLARRPGATPPQLTEAERARAAALLARNEAGERG
jgi:cytochrome c-type biogenesis protein CcmH